MKVAFFSTMKGTPWGGSEELWAAACGKALDGGDQAFVSVWEWADGQPKLAPIRGRGAIWAPRPRRVPRLARIFLRPPWLTALNEFNPDVVCLSQGGAYECAGHRSMVPLLKWLRRSEAVLVNLIQFNSAAASLGRRAAVRARWLYQRASVNAFVAQANIDEAARRLGRPIPRSVVVRNPVNISDQSLVLWPADPVARFATVGRLDAKTKGQDMLLTALSRPEWLAREWSLSLFGQGPDEARFRDTVRQTGLGGRVRFVGHTDDIRAVWGEHHVHLLPSRAEGTPLAMVEAMVLGRPCLVGRAGGCADWIDDGAEGWVAEPTPERVAAALDRMWAARRRWPELGLAARARALRQLGPDPGGALLDIMREATRARNPGAAPLT